MNQRIGVAEVRAEHDTACVGKHSPAGVDRYVAVVAALGIAGTKVDLRCLVACRNGRRGALLFIVGQRCLVAQPVVLRTAIEAGTFTEMAVAFLYVEAGSAGCAQVQRNSDAQADDPVVAPVVVQRLRRIQVDADAAILRIELKLVLAPLQAGVPVIILGKGQAQRAAAEVLVDRTFQAAAAVAR